MSNDHGVRIVRMSLRNSIDVVNAMDLEALPVEEADAISQLLTIAVSINSFLEILPYAEQLDHIYDHVEASEDFPPESLEHKILKRTGH